MTNYAGKPYAGKPHVRIDEGGREWNYPSPTILVVIFLFFEFLRLYKQTRITVSLKHISQLNGK